MGKPLLAPQAPFILPLNADTEFTDYNVGTGGFLFAVMPINAIASLQFITEDYASSWTMDLYPLKLYVFEVPPTVSGFWVTDAFTSPTLAVYGYFPGRDH